MHSSTKSFVTHRTSLLADEKGTDGGRSLLTEAFDLIRTEKQVGKLTAHFGVGGSISSLIFEETENFAQSEIEVSEN